METNIVPVYVISGFLESGKSFFTKYTIGQDYFDIPDKTLLIVCEEGEEEYEKALLEHHNTVIEFIEDESDFNADTLVFFEEKHVPGRVIIEYNGMWNMQKLYKTILPYGWQVNQQITIVDGSSFKTYFGNMKSIFMEIIKFAELIIFNRCSEEEDIVSYRRNIKVVNPNAEIIFEGPDGELDASTEEDLPYDVHAEVIEVPDISFGIWYMDAMEHRERYIGKTIRFKGMALIADGMPENHFVPGRMAMTCCADDIAFIGYICKHKGVNKLANKEWITVEAEMTYEFFEGYNTEGPVLYAKKIEKSNPPKEELIYF